MWRSFGDAQMWIWQHWLLCLLSCLSPLPIIHNGSSLPVRWDKHLIYFSIKYLKAETLFCLWGSQLLRCLWQGGGVRLLLGQIWTIICCVDSQGLICHNLLCSLCCEWLDSVVGWITWELGWSETKHKIPSESVKLTVVLPAKRNWWKVETSSRQFVWCLFLIRVETSVGGSDFLFATELAYVICRMGFCPTGMTICKPCAIDSWFVIQVTFEWCV